MASNKSLTVKRRSAYTFSTVSVALVLFIFGAAMYLAMNAAKATNAVMDDMRVVVILNKELKAERLTELQALVTKDELVVRSEYVSSADAEKDFKEYIGEDFSINLGSNPLPASINLYLNNELDAIETAEAIKIRLKKVAEVDEVLYQQGVMSTISSNLASLKIVLSIFGLVLVLISIIMIDNTIRMAVLSRRFLIKTMLLIGATRGFIRRPFVAKALLQAFVSTLIASVMLAVLIVAMKRSVPELEIIFEDYQTLLIIPVTLFVAALIVCVISTCMAVNRYMKLNNNELHTY